MKLLNVGVIAITTTLAACSGEIHRTGQIGSVQYLSVDARQRLVITGTRADGQPVVCAEPSPDVFAVLAASVNAGRTASVGEGAQTVTEIAAATGESAATIGLRTEAITLLRDGYFRACEGYLNGVLSSDQYMQIVNQLDGLMVALVGLATVGGTVAAPPVTIRAGGSATGGDNATVVTEASNPTVQIGRNTAVDAAVAKEIRNIINDYYKAAKDLRPRHR